MGQFQMHGRGVNDVGELQGSNEMRDQFPEVHLLGRPLVDPTPSGPVDRQGQEHGGSWLVSEPFGRIAKGQNGLASTRLRLAWPEGTATSSSWSSNNGGWYPREAMEGDTPVAAETNKLWA